MIDWFRRKTWTEADENEYLKSSDVSGSGAGRNICGYSL